MLKCSLRDCCDAYIIDKDTIIITGAGADTAARNENGRNKQITLKNCASCTD